MDIQKIQSYSIQSQRMQVSNLKSSAPKEAAKQETGKTQTLNEQVAEFRRSLQAEIFKSIQQQAGTSSLTSMNESIPVDLSQLKYNGQSLSKLTPEKASELVSEDGYLGIKQTSQRIADFVIKGGGDDINKLRAGREGIIRGFKEAEKAWGNKLPDISHQTLDKALEKIDEHINKIGGKVIETVA